MPEGTGTHHYRSSNEIQPAEQNRRPTRASRWGGRRATGRLRGGWGIERATWGLRRGGRGRGVGVGRGGGGRDSLSRGQRAPAAGRGRGLWVVSVARVPHPGLVSGEAPMSGELLFSSCTKSLRACACVHVHVMCMQVGEVRCIVQVHYKCKVQFVAAGWLF